MERAFYVYKYYGPFQNIFLFQQCAKPSAIPLYWLVDRDSSHGWLMVILNILDNINQYNHQPTKELNIAAGDAVPMT